MLHIINNLKLDCVLDHVIIRGQALNLFCWLSHDYFGQTLLQLKHLCSEKLHFYTSRVINNKSQLPYPKPYFHLLKGLHPRVEKVFIRVIVESLLIV